MSAPWRAVVGTRKVKLSSNKLLAYNELECGHSFEVRGQAALDAAHAKRRRCVSCETASPITDAMFEAARDAMGVMAVDRELVAKVYRAMREREQSNA